MESLIQLIQVIYLYRPGYWYWSLSSFLSNVVFAVGTNGYLGNANVNYTDGAVAPTINLTYEYASTLIGDGTMKNPYRAE